MVGRKGAKSVARVADGAALSWVGAGLLAMALAGWAVAARAQDGVTQSHAITTFGDAPKYPADFTHLDYVNPDAPKGGEISIWTAGGFDSLNPYSIKGRAAALASRASSFTVHLPSELAVVLLVWPANSTTICSPASAHPHTGTAVADCSTM
jgi:hypothetical protein